MRLIAVTDPSLAQDHFENTVKLIISSGIDALIFRNTQQSSEDYCKLSNEFKKYCEQNNVEFIVHRFFDVANSLQSKIHLPYAVFDQNKNSLQKYSFGVSVHNEEEAKKAIENGASWLIFGNVFETECKPGKTPAGLDSLKRICGLSSVPVYAIGGITPQNAEGCKESRAQGVCVRSLYMKSSNPKEVTDLFRQSL